MSAQAPVYNESRPARLWVRLAPLSVKKLDRYAEHQGITRAGLLHKIVREWLDTQLDEPEGAPVRSKRIYDRSEYMRERIEARERAARTTAAVRAVSKAQEDLEARFQEIAQALQEVDKAVQAVAGPEEQN